MQGNTKLGERLIWSFSIPAITTCPGASALCQSLCYARKGHYRMPSVSTKYARNLTASYTDEFVRDVTGEIKRFGIAVVRIHGSGDFYEPQYVKKWLAIAARCPQALFYAYSRSWREPAVLAGLREFAQLPNVHLWYSEDRETGPAPSDPGIRRGYMLEDDANEAEIPAGCDLVFRVHATRAAKKMNTVQVCPYEQHVAERKTRLTCERCRICFTPKRPTRKVD